MRDGRVVNDDDSDGDGDGDGDFDDSDSDSDSDSEFDDDDDREFDTPVCIFEERWVSPIAHVGEGSAMRRGLVQRLTWVTLLGGALAACGARSTLPIDESSGGAGGTGGCNEGDTRLCGSHVGECRQGTESCQNGVFGDCIGAVDPAPETCNGLDDDCDGSVDEDFDVGQACDGADTDLCLDDVMSCGGCSKGADNVEVCNGIDDNCNGIIDADCTVGDCKPTLEVVGSTPSSASCIDFPVMAGSVGDIEFPCGGGPVTATLDGIPFTGQVTNDVVSLTGSADVIGPDGCTWETNHSIDGNLSAGSLTYAYEEHVIHGVFTPCWQPCTEVGQVTIRWGTGQ